MGRHRRSAPIPPAAPPADPEPDPSSGRRRAGHRGTRRRGPLTPVRTGLLGASAAVVLGAAAMNSGMLPGGDHMLGANDGAGRVRTDSLPTSDPGTQGVPSATPTDRGTPSASRSSDRSKAPTRAPKPSADPSRKPSAKPSPSRTADPRERTGDSDTRPTPSRTATPTPRPSSTPSTPSDPETAAEREVLDLVNQERARAGCSPLTADPELAELAGDFSADMDARDFFDHTDPDGLDPFERAEQAGVTNLGGENIARGQANAQSVMDSWMNSAGHRANILNCDFRTMGVGAHFAEGGPWWTQEFGF